MAWRSSPSWRFLWRRSKIPPTWPNRPKQGGDRPTVMTRLHQRGQIDSLSARIRPGRTIFSLRTQMDVRREWWQEKTASRWCIWKSAEARARQLLADPSVYPGLPKRAADSEVLHLGIASRLHHHSWTVYREGRQFWVRRVVWDRGVGPGLSGHDARIIASDGVVDGAVLQTMIERAHVLEQLEPSGGGPTQCFVHCGR